MLANPGFDKHKVKSEITEEAAGNPGRGSEGTKGNPGRGSEEPKGNLTKAFYTIINTSPLAMMLLGPDTRVLDWNPAAEQFFGWTKAEACELPNPLIAAEKQEEFRSLVERVLLGESCIGREFRFRRKDGSLIEVNVSMWPVSQGAGPAQVIVAQVDEIDDLMRISPDPSVSFDHLGYFKTFNRAAERLSGYAAAEVIGKHFSQVGLIKRRVIVALLRKFRPLLQGIQKEGFQTEETEEAQAEGVQMEAEEPATFEVDIIRKDGSSVTMEANPRLMKRQGRITGIHITFRDISRRKQAEELFRILADNSPTGIYITQDGKFKYVNPQFQEHTGYTAGEMVGKDAYELVHPENRSKVKENSVQMLKGQRSSPYEFRFINKRGEVRWLMGTITSITYQGKRAALGNYMDITEYKRAEERIRYLSFHDQLTGLYNRAYFEEEMKRVDVERQLPVSLIMGDVNGLKLVNDAFGHQEGDRLLCKIARILQDSCRKEDVICRWGGDEFAIILPRTDESAAMRITERIRTACSAAARDPIQPSIALGAATKQEPAENLYRVLQEAENRMYRNKLTESKSARSSLISSLQKTLWEKSFETEEHCNRLRQMALEMGRALDLPDSQLDELNLLAALHDIGKVAIPEEIIKKPGALSPEELETVRKHPEIGCRIAESSPELAYIADAILSHHEWWDGSGYPRGLRGEEIPLTARIIAIIDAFDVMTHQRPYREPVSPLEALEELQGCVGTQFDPVLVELFLQVVRWKEEPR